MRHGFLSLLLLLAGGFSLPALGAVENTAYGSIAGQAGSIQPSPPLRLNVEELTLVKESRDSAGNLMARDALTGQGAVVWFVIYLNNNLDSALDDIQIEDVVASGVGNFTVQELSSGIHAEALDLSTVDAGTESARISAAWNAAWTPISDGSGDHANALNSGEYDSTTQTFRFGTAATSVQVPAKTLRAYRIKVIIN